MVENSILVKVRGRCLRRFVAFGGGAVLATVVSLAFVLDARTDTRDPGGSYVVGGCVLLFAGYLLWRSVPAWQCLIRPERHHLIQRLAAWGDPAGVALAVDEEARGPKFPGDKGWSMTNRFLIRSTFLTYEVLRLEDLVWAYQAVTRHSVNRMPTGTTREAVFYFNGGMARVRGLASSQMLAFATQKAPWAFAGYSEELEQRFSSNPREVLDAVFARRAPPGPASRGGPSDLHTSAAVTLATAMTGGKVDVKLRYGSLERHVRVTVPPGIDSSQRLRVPGKGKPESDGTPPGDLYVEILVAPDARFERRGDDLETQLRITSAAAAGGSTAKVELPDASTTTVEIPPGTSDGARLTVAGRGMPKLGASGRGELRLTVEVSDSPTH